MQNGQGKLLTTNSNILKECKKYFQTLYTKHTHMRKLKNFLLKDIISKITDIQNYSLIKKIQINEIREAIKSIEKANP